MSQDATARTPGEAIAAMNERFKTIDRVTNSLKWATMAYRLGMATAEQPTASPEQNLRDALGFYQQASEVLTAQRAPLEHGRILNAAGSAQRLLGDRGTAARLFTQASELMAGRGAVVEEASVLNNLGLVLAEVGQLDEAIEAFTTSLSMLPSESDEHTRTALATKHNLGQAYLASGDLAGCDASIAVLSEASVQGRSVDAAMHSAMIDHSLGVAWKTKASITPGSADEMLAEAIASFELSLGVFTSVGFPMQHAIAKHNLAHALAGRDDLASLQRALVYYEDALNIFDPRMHQAQWQEVFKNAEAVEVRLGQLVPGATRADHTASFAGALSATERLMFVRQRFAHLERLPEVNRVERLTTFAFAVVSQPAESFVAILRTVIEVLMELPEALLQSALRGQLAAHAMLDPHDQRAADFVLDEVINALLFGPQRIRVRDILEDIGWDRP